MLICNISGSFNMSIIHINLIKLITMVSCVCVCFLNNFKCVLIIEIQTNKYSMQCLEMIESYAQSFKNLSNQMPMWMMCENMWLCNKNMSRAVRQFHNSNCLNGPSYWCASLKNAQECKVIINLICLLFFYNLKVLLIPVFFCHNDGHCIVSITF